ncbi:MAG: O-antigen flippase Wzx [Ignavibacteriae bacterium]|nr:MAG: O-antigen flippase Wzx [Ignavibacteriota bacterium]
MNVINLMVEKITDYFTKGHGRSIIIKRNILISFILKGISVVISFIMVPITLNYLNVERYGIWLTLNSIISWFYILDIGLGNGLRNKFAEAVARGEKELAKKYVSTAYTILLIIIIFFYVFFLFINPHIDWTKILNTNKSMDTELINLVLIVVTFFCIQFILKLIGTIYIADQKPALSDSLNVISNAISLIIIFILTKTTEGNLIYVGAVFTISPVIIYLLASIISFSTIYKSYRPSIYYIDFSKVKDIGLLGIKFFIIQISGIVIYSTSNIIITQVLGPAEVTPYNIAYKYFNTVMMFFMIIMTPFWSGFTDAYSKNDFEWIKSTMKKLNKFSLGVIIIVIVMILLSDTIYKIWIGSQVKVPFLLTLFMGFYIMIISWGAPFVHFINGVGKIKLQLYFSVFQAVVFLILAVYFSKYLGYGSIGVITAMCIPMLPSIFLWPIQYKMIIENNKSGIWNK